MTAAPSLSPSNWTDSQQEYERKKLAGECLWCASAVAADSAYCNEHGPRVRQHKRDHIAKVRQQRRANGMCAACGATKSKAYRCSKCLGVDNGVDNRKPQRPPFGVAYAPPARPRKGGVWTVDTATEADGRTRSRNRFRGHGRRGGPKGFEVDDWDLRAMESEISRARAALSVYWSDENQELPRIQRIEPRREALGHLELVQRFVDELVERTRKAVK